MSHLSVTDISYAHPGGEDLFFGVSFLVSPGEHVALIGNNGVGKSTLMRILGGGLEPDEGEISIGGPALHMPQDVGFDRPNETVRQMLLRFAPRPLDEVGRRITDAELRLAEGDDRAGLELGDAISEWSDLGGYELEARWDATLRRVMRVGLSEVGDRKVTELSGGERKQIVLDALFHSDAAVLLLDEPDNYLDIPAKRWLENLLATSPKTVLLISHDRELLGRAAAKVVTLEATGAWIHPESYVTYEEAREKRQRSLGDELQRWKEEERRLFQHYKIMKQRAALNSRNAPKADAAETRWRRFVDAGPPPPPVPDQRIHVRLRGSASGRRVLRCGGLGLDGLVLPFDTELRFGERVGLIGPNGSGKSHLMRLFAGEDVPFEGSYDLGSRVRPGHFTQVNVRDDFLGSVVVDIVSRWTGNHESSMSALARYGLQASAHRPYDTLSGGQKARLEVLCLELEGSNLLLLDEPTDNLDIDSSVALEHALDGFEGTVLAVSHDRAFLRTLDWFLYLQHDGRFFEITDYEDAVRVVAGETDPHSSGSIRSLTVRRT
ncbi:hypothetical protein BJF83_22635 [Nocardiopsis sp. CNR-923]|uniref:ABC-F family ATP-binding cassette domain-containing protein n=1 Tax=Nocardiopsis sp. CNR-923 TaxID=1904965 RepID=UPI00096970E3|nr:ABC-F family ATP-binding cassette domain-containing protein [Nocardiopsis sp. CNR-923]OLT25783.1 hypothetical protein BJF83_22635 [Nocardiopsis sp. CNR-923]